ncbi:MAG: PglZ domain-containing protein [Cyclobacteriaceae bacterium]|nr:PglZ domain-containing protein [Cyclobacteriaceae bacterium]
MQRYNILWADDEIDLLKPHIMFLDKKGYDVIPVNSGSDALEKFDSENFDIVFLDENMPGMTGLETLTRIKEIRPDLPVVMITKSEEEHIMEEAIASKIADYLIKPLNPNQILLSVKKILENKRLVTEKTNLNYQQQFQQISMVVNDYLDYKGWTEIYQKLVYWELELESNQYRQMKEILEMQKMEANSNFVKYVKGNYEDWLNPNIEDKPVLSHTLLKEKVFPRLKNGTPTFFIIIDNLRFDQWKVIEPLITEFFRIEFTELYYSILPTTTAYARNAIFSGLLPLEMSMKYPDIWMNEDEEGGKNNHEEDFLARHIKRLRMDTRISYQKIKNLNQGRNLVDNIYNLAHNDLNVIVYNFVDMLSHARTEMEIIRELAPDESAYRSLTRSWFQHSPLLEIIQRIAEMDARLVITTDHGTVRVKKPFRIIGDRNTNTNLRYKIGKNLNFEEERIYYTRSPEHIHLPKVNVSSTYVFAVEDLFFAYPNNFNYYVNYYKDTFQHGGLSMEEMIIPIISLNSK